MAHVPRPKMKQRVADQLKRPNKLYRAGRERLADFAVRTLHFGCGHLLAQRNVNDEMACKREIRPSDIPAVRPYWLLMNVVFR